VGGYLIIGLAGHIDHGKSALVTALTGRPMDRLAEERRRGITIDLNFAPLVLAGGTVAGVVDVPGHEDFVRTMAAGASGADLALFVIAADEGWKPQTHEHLAVLEYIRVPLGIPVITKADLASDARITLLSAEVADRLRSSPVAFAPPSVVSIRTGQGLDALRGVIESLARKIVARRVQDLFRLPIDRVFSVAGVGTVVTGTAWSGTVAVGDAVTVLPGRLAARVRSIEEHGKSRSRSEPGARTAVGLAGISREGITRGTVLVSEGEPWPVTTAFDAMLALSQEAPRPLNTQSRVRVLMGTAEVMARVHPRVNIPPGSDGGARLVLEQPVVARGGDRFVVRSYSPVTTIGGGVVLDPDPPRRSVWSPLLLEVEPEARLLGLLARRPEGIDSRALPFLLGVPPVEASAVAARTRDVRPLDHRWVADSAVRTAGEGAIRLVRAHHASHPESRGIPLETLRRSLRAPEAIVEMAIGDLVAAGQLRIGEGAASLPEFVPLIPGGGEAGVARLVRLVEEAGLMPPTLSELAAGGNLRDLEGVARVATARGMLTAVERDRYYGGRALDRFTLALRELGQNGSISPATLRDRLGISRKYLIPLLEWADREGITVRVGDGRRLKG
jgi:selenocysteine-specific elongation factor